ncbi:MAG: leucine-rich repeat protein, partial [Clostridia bacterium]|nr:leucine-rich repeat protein [Clostridia bacterium]
MLHKEAEDVLYNGQEKDNLGIYKFSDYGLSFEEAETVWYAFRYDASAFFIVSNSYSYNYNSITVKIAPEFLDKGVRNNVLEEVKNSVEEVRQLLVGIQATAMKFKIIYDYVMGSTLYYHDFYGVPIFNGFSYSIAGPLDRDNSTGTICQGYAHAVKYLCDIFGIDCIYVGSESRSESQKHALNIVNIDGKWYYADSTKDDTSEDKYEFFLKGHDEVWEEFYNTGNDESDNYLRSFLPALDKNDFNSVVSDGTLYYSINELKNSVSIEGGVKGLKDLSIPSTFGNVKIESINDYAFRNHDSLTSVVMQDGIKSIGYRAFLNCKNLTTIKLSNKIESISETSFKGCDNITTATLPTKAVIGIPKSNLKEVVINGGDSIDNRAFFSSKSLTKIEIANTVKSIGSSAFSDCINLTSIEISASVKSIGFDAFSNCSSLTSIELPASVTSIDSSAFSNCSALTSINIPSGVTTI